MSDVEQWNADMDAWGLSGSQRIYHLWRLHAYHRRIEDLYWQRWERADRAQVWCALAVVLLLIVGLVLL